MRRPAWPRSVRARLVGACALVTLLLAVGGVALLVALLHRGVNASLDASLDARAAPLVASLRAPGPLDYSGAATSPAARGDQPDPVDVLSVVYRPDGQVAQAQPAGLPTATLTPALLAVARLHPVKTTATIGGEGIRILATPVHRSDGTWVVGVGVSTTATNETVSRSIHELALAVPVLVLLAALGAWILSGAALRPVERMRADAEDMGEHDLANRLTVPDTKDELAKLARTFNALLDRLHRSVARQRDLVADAGHELRTPLSVLRTELELADRPGRSREDLADAVTHAREEVERLSKLAENLLFLARADGPSPIIQPEPTDVAALLTGAARAWRVLADCQGVEITVTSPTPLTVCVDPIVLRRAVDNLIANALSVTTAPGAVGLSAATDGRGGTTIRICDSGPGFPPDLLPHAFERFRRADAARSGSGSGLGLAIVREIARAHGGSVYAANGVAGGAVVTITLPHGSG
jgi:heavy metal sensor kinase